MSMSLPPGILTKIKLLLNLTQSSNYNEAENARAMADKLIAKYHVTEEDLSSLEEKEYYGEDEKLYVTIGMVGWRRQLALAVATYFDCQIVQEELVPVEGLHQFNYFVYGDNDQVRDVQFVYHAFAKKVEYLVDTRCLGRGDIYLGSYTEGVVEAIKNNIQMFGIDVPEVKRTLKKEVSSEAAPPKSNTLTTTSGHKEEPTDKRVDVNSQSFIKDMVAYFNGIGDGRKLSLEDILSIEVKTWEAKQFQEEKANADV